MKKRVLTGINTTGTLHIGNYVGAIRPAIRDSRNPDTESFFFMADLHALIKCQDPARIARSRLQIAATWLAAGLDPERVVFYRQSDIPEIPTLNWLLTCSTGKGQMNRAHAYKAAVDQAVAAGRDPDADVSMGLFCYPILMAADILMFNADEVPVGHDQLQHLEMARDVATRFNFLYATPEKPFFSMPVATGGSEIEVLPGLDGRKMSKSYNNVIPLFEGGRKALDEAISRIVTDSRLPGEPKDPDSTSLTVIYDAFATKEESEAFHAELRAGLGWGEAKKRLADKIDAEIGPMRARYEELMARPEEIEKILQEGARKARAIATPFLAELMQAVGLKSFTQADAPAAQAKSAKAVKALFKQYREKDGNFYFKLSMNGRDLFVSDAFASGRDAGTWVGRLKREAELPADAPIHLLDGVSADEVTAALASLRTEE
ncbi:tryptophan--tRNA ligase [Sutterella megalosphaeroides]|uniref:Tryptophan--tRNA ligase n=1 Tax=Sutterella megalosphaeroides TaxID=2494234 RepID=A0A2Z6I786_9BURK|nr:tryptophan--tRNA ligase [Sutterella megalosphaeroides]BBF22239.1 tryptophan--tRNA ligase [Sutterella megalosphaeroides]